MRQIVIDQLRPEERQEIGEHLKRETDKGPVDGMYYLALPEGLLDEEQKGHQGCGPFHFSVDLREESVAFELLVRGRSTLHCSCIRYADVRQRDFLFTFIDAMVAATDVRA